MREPQTRSGPGGRPARTVPAPARRAPCAGLAVALLSWLAAGVPGSARAFDVVLNAQREFLDAYLIDGTPSPRRVVFIDPDPPEPDNRNGPPARVGRHVNGKVCFFPPGHGHDGKFVVADDTYREACVDRNQPQARCAIRRRRNPQWVGRDPDGWGVFRADGTWTKRVIKTSRRFAEPAPQGSIDPQGCAFDRDGNLWLTDVGHGGFGETDGALIVFFPGRDNQYRKFCFVDTALASPGMPALDDAGNIYVPEPGALRLTKFSPPFPSSRRDCARRDRVVTVPPTKTVVPTPGTTVPNGIVRVPGTDRWYIDSVILPALVNEHDATGAFVRTIVPANVPKNPIGIDVGADGTLYYAELDLDPQTFRTRCGRMSMARFDTLGTPQAPEVIGRNLRFPDGVTVVDSSRLDVDLASLPPPPDPPGGACAGE